jgi:hypothetical protein
MAMVSGHSRFVTVAAKFGMDNPVDFGISDRLLFIAENFCAHCYL